MTIQASRKSLSALCIGLAAALLAGVWLLGRSPIQPGAVALEGEDPIAIARPPAAKPGELIPLDVEPTRASGLALAAVESPGEKESNARPKTIAAALAQPQLIGRVVDEGGEPIEGADCLFSTASDFGRSRAELGTETGFEPNVRNDVIHWVTEAAGEIRVSMGKPIVPGKDLNQRPKATLRPGAPLTGFIRRAGFIPLRLEGQPVSAFRPHDLGDLVMRRGQAISGIVQSLEGEPIPGARLTLQQPRARGLVLWKTPGRGLDLGVTDRDGRFRCDELRAGSFKLIVEAPRACTVVYEGDTRDRLSAGEIKIRVQTGAVLHGRVLDVPQGRRIAVEARVPLGTAKGDRPDVGARARSALVSTTDGSFSIYGLTPGMPVQLNAVEVAPFGRRATGDRVREVKGVEVYPGLNDEALLSWAALSGLHGRVVVPSEEGGGLVGHGSFVLSVRYGEIEEHPFATHALVLQGQVQRYCAAGRFSFDAAVGGAPGGPPVHLRVRAVGYEDFELLNVALQPGASRDLGDLVLRPIPAVHVKVVDAETGDSLSRARVYLGSVRWEEEFDRAVKANQSLWNSAKICFGETGGSGIATLSVPPSGAPWLLAVCADGYVASEPISMHSATVEQVVALRRGSVVEVTAVDSSGVPQSGVDVQIGVTDRPGRRAVISPDGLRMRSTTDREGKATFYGVPSGSMLVGAIPPVTAVAEVSKYVTGPYNWRSQGLSVVVPRRYEVELEVPSFVDFEGSVTANRVPVAGARVQLEVDDRSWEDVPTTRSPRLEAITDAAGRFRFGGVPRARYQAFVSHPDRSMVMQSRLFVKPSMVEPVFELPDVWVEGQVLFEESGVPVEGAEVTISSDRVPAAKIGVTTQIEDSRGRIEENTEWLEPGTIVTDSQGRFEFRGVATGVSLVLTTKGANFETTKTKVKAVGRMTNYQEVTVSVTKKP